MKKAITVKYLVIMMSMFLLAACGGLSDEEATTLVGEYKGTLEDLYTEINSKYEENPSPEDWQAFSKEWMPKLTAAEPSELRQEEVEKYSKELSALNAAGSQMMYLWSEYDKVIAGEELNQGTVDQLKSNIEEALANVEE